MWILCFQVQAPRKPFIWSSSEGYDIADNIEIRNVELLELVEVEISSWTLNVYRPLLWKDRRAALGPVA